MTVFFMVYILCQIKCLILNILIKLIRALQKIFFLVTLKIIVTLRFIFLGFTQFVK